MHLQTPVGTQRLLLYQRLPERYHQSPVYRRRAAIFRYQGCSFLSFLLLLYKDLNSCYILYPAGTVRQQQANISTEVKHDESMAVFRLWIHLRGRDASRHMSLLQRRMQLQQHHLLHPRVRRPGEYRPETGSRKKRQRKEEGIAIPPSIGPLWFDQEMSGWRDR